MIKRASSFSLATNFGLMVLTLDVEVALDALAHGDLRRTLVVRTLVVVDKEDPWLGFVILYPRQES